MTRPLFALSDSMKRLLALAVVALLAYLAWGFYAGSTPEGKARQEDEARIKECRKRAAAEADNQAMKIHADECAEMQAAFDRKWQ